MKLPRYMLEQLEGRSAVTSEAADAAVSKEAEHERGEAAARLLEQATPSCSERAPEKP